jgi:formyltetrahydrofolate deformylase
MRKYTINKVMGKTVVGITVVGKDREGIVATFTNFAFSKGGNIEKVNQNVIKGLFGMYLEVSFSKIVNVEKFDAEIQNLSKKEKMDVSTHHETNSEKNIAILVTKEPLCLEIILNKAKSLKGKISVIIGTEKTLEPLAKKAKIPFVAVEEKNQQKAEEKIIEICKKYNIDLISLARYMRILSPNFVWRYPNRIINIHPSLLPAFPGASAYAQAYERGTKIVGVTSHYVTENLDQGPIIFQDSFKVDPNDTLEKIKAKGQKLEAETLLKATKMHLENKLEVRWRKVHIKSK